MMKCRRRQATDPQKLKKIVNGRFFVFCKWKRKRLVWKRLKNNRFHIPAFNTYLSQSKKVSICKDLEEQKESDRKYICKVLARVLCVIKFLSSRELVFRGSSELIGSPKNGNFPGILELVAEYDTFLAEHI